MTSSDNKNKSGSILVVLLPSPTSDYMLHTNELHILLNVFIASILTMLVGIEREKARKEAGIRTNMIVGGFTCLTVCLIHPLVEFSYSNVVNDTIDADPIRVLQAIVIGVSFIGAGTIIKSRTTGKVSGLTTAATLLYSIGIGICVAIEYYILAVSLTVLILVINHLVNFLIRKYTSIKG